MKTIFIGIDVSKEKVDASVISRRNPSEFITKIKHEEFINNTAGFRKMVKWVKSITGSTAEQMQFCVETTGSYDLPMCNFLHSEGLSVWREHALQLKLSIGLRRGKDDIRDAWDIADYAARNIDKAVDYKPLSPAIKSLRILLNHRADMVERKRALGNQRQALEITAAKRDAASKFILRDITQQINDMERRIKECANRMEEVVKSDPAIAENYARLTSIPGIGAINAGNLIAYTSNFTAFATPNKIATYFGVASFRIKSGSSVDRRSSVRQYSSPKHKSYLSEAALAAVRFNPALRQYYERLLLRGKPRMVILNNVKNKLIHIAFSMVKNKRFYDKDFEINRLLANAQKP